MSRMSQATRSRRFSVKNGEKVCVVIDTRNGDTLRLTLLDCSITGVRTKTIDKDFDTQWIELGSIVSSAKIVAGEKESSLGRVVLRRADELSDCYSFAFSTVDVQIPVNGFLSRFLEINLNAAGFDKDLEISPDKFSLANFIENEFTNIDIFDRVREFSFFHDEWLKSGKYAYQHMRVDSKGPRIQLKRKRKNGRNDYLMMGSNDYLGFGSHPEVVQAAKQAMDTYGFGSTGSPVTTGSSDLHGDLCDKLARIHQKEAALLFNSGYTANIGIITSLCSTNDLIIADQLCHASIQDAMTMSKGTSRFFKHNNVEHLRSILSKERDNFNGALVVTEGVFSMDGDTACLDQIYAVARQFNCRVMVDQAHCWGVVGPNGLGICDKFNMLRDVDVIMGTFSKVAGAIGGFVVGSRELIDWLRSFSRSQIFSVSIPPSTVAAASKSIDLMMQDRSHLEKLRVNIRHFITGLQSVGCEMNPHHESAVIPVVIGDESKMGEMYQSLLDDGIWCTPVVYPAVSRRNCRFRFTVMSTHTISDLDYAISSLEKAAMKVGFDFRVIKESAVKKAA